ncbi:universal stress protein [Mycobacteroides salmoniphilum]|uniref:universal stress protein n=1 Tax=Mycobacteroides salmoniphilum TaxID=404941 RepID=UPI00099434CE|nr:universal stress protein [Mycobacteroides salmoniphilum]QCH22587.1 Universal stress protein [Mycobacteroides salmoniphilum]
MFNTDQSGPVVVGIDGSQAALFAAESAIDEAISRDVPLSLVHVTRPLVTTKSSPAAEGRHDERFAESSLRAAAAAIEAIGKPVKVDTILIRGLPSEALVFESRSASLICIGAGRFAHAALGSTATRLAERAHCPVLIARAPMPDQPSELSVLENTEDGSSWNASRQNWIAVCVNGSKDNRNVVDHAIREARLRQLPVLAISTWPLKLGEGMNHELERRVASLHEQYGDVHIYPVTTRARIARFIARCHEPIALAVIGASEARQAVRLCRSSREQCCSVLVVRP